MIHPPAGRRNKYLALSTAFLLVGGFALGLALAPSARANDPSTVPALKRVEAKCQAAAAKVMAATVGIINLSLAGGGRMGEGSGVVVSEDGLVLTAGHVLGQPGAELTIIFPDGRRATAKALGANFTRDSGLVKIVEKGKWPHVEMGHSDDVKPGSWCMALGHPGGVQLGRTPPIRLGRVLVGGRRGRFIVTDATVISGDSGGPLFDLEGRVIGIHSNIGMSVNQNQHVPIDVYRSQWTDLLASKTFGSPRDMQPGGDRISPAKARRFEELFFGRMMAGDPEAKALLKDGQFLGTPEDIDRLLAKWEKAETESKAAAAKTAASKTNSSSASAPATSSDEPLDVLKFQRLLHDRLLSGDVETLKLIKNGKMLLTPSQMRQLMDDWEKKSLAATTSQNEPLDILKFQRLFQDRLLSGDPETRKLIKNGQLLLTPLQMRQLMDDWEKKSVAANGSKPKPGDTASKTSTAKTPTDKTPADKAAPTKGADGKVAGPDQPRLPRRWQQEMQQPTPPKANPEDLAKLRDIMKNAVPLGDGSYRIRGSDDVTQSLRALPGWDATSRVMSYGKSSPQLLREIVPVAAQAGRSTAVVLCDGKPAVLGTVIRKDGYIVTKSSELHGKISCKIGGRELPATIVKTRREHDLVLLKVDAGDLEPVAWADGDSPVLGSWLITPSGDNDVLGLGIVSIADRTIPDAPTMLLRNRALIGVLIDQQAKNALVQAVNPGMPAERGGIRAGDVIEKIDGQAITGPKEVNQFLGKYKPGDKILVRISRAGKPMAMRLELVSSERFAPKSTGDHLTRLSEAGGTVSKRHGSFVIAFTHDTVLQATDCGGPVVNLDGRAVGLNIARADRTATYAIPAKMIRMLIPEMLPK
jgi:S1-C subfamily serine protease